MANVIGGSGTLTKMGTAVLTLSSSNAYTGATTISAGKIIMGNAYALGPGSNTSTVTVNSGGTLDINSTNAGINSQNLNVTGTGYDGNGVLVSNGLSDIYSSVLGKNLTGPTTFGGSVRWDIRGTGGIPGRQRLHPDQDRDQLHLSGPPELYQPKCSNNQQWRLVPPRDDHRGQFVHVGAHYREHRRNAVGLLVCISGCQLHYAKWRQRGYRIY